MSESEKKKIINDMKKAGLPLEIEVSSVLETYGWVVHNQEGYLDCDENKWRTIDVAAHKRIELPNSLSYKALNVSLIIECKKSEKPWAFYIKGKKGSTTFNPLMACGLVKQESNPPLHPLYLTNMANIFH